MRGVEIDKAGMEGVGRGKGERREGREGRWVR